MSPQVSTSIPGPAYYQQATGQASESAGRTGAASEPRFRRGYTAPPAERAVIAAAHATRLWLSASLALGDQAIMVACAIAVAWPRLWHGWGVPLGLLGAALGSLVVGRQLRALECLAHEASHYNWSRRNRQANDVLVTVLAGLPTGVHLAVYRESHTRHHGRFGTSDDPDRRNYELLGLEALDRSSAASFVLGSLSRLTAYRRRWKEASLGPGNFPVAPLVWASVMMVLLAGLVWWRLSAAIVGVCVWLAGRYVVLPIIRFLGESSEHVYLGETTVFDATITNLGLMQRLVIHPHGDGYHTIHHLWPGVPHHQVRNLHKRLLAADPDGYAKRLRCRTRFFSLPVRGAEPQGIIRYRHE